MKIHKLIYIFYSLKEIQPDDPSKFAQGFLVHPSGKSRYVLLLNVAIHLLYVLLVPDQERRASTETNATK